MARSSNPQLVRQWRERLQRFHHSELTVAEFCQSEGYSVASFYQWQRKLQAALPSVPLHAGDHDATDEQQCRLIKNVVQSLTEVTS